MKSRKLLGKDDKNNMKGFPRTYDRFIRKMLLELKRDLDTYVFIDTKQQNTVNGWRDYDRVIVVQKYSDGTHTSEIITPGLRTPMLRVSLKRGKESIDIRHNEMLAVYYARQVQKAIPETQSRINRMLSGCPYIGELKCGWEFILGGVVMKLIKYDSENKSYLVSLLNQNGKKVYLDAKKFRRVTVELCGYFDTKNIYKVVPKKETYPIISDMNDFKRAIESISNKGDIK
jgi:hypothetical protein